MSPTPMGPDRRPDPHLVIHLKTGVRLPVQLIDYPTDESGDVDIEYVSSMLDRMRQAGAFLTKPTDGWTFADVLCVPWDSVDYIEVIL